MEVLGGISTSTNTSATAFIETIRAGEVRIRLNFVVTHSASSFEGQNTRNDNIIEDPQVYQNAFGKIGDGIFIRKGI